MDRRTIIFLIVLFFLLSTPGENEHSNSDNEKKAQQLYTKEWVRQREVMLKSHYGQGYGNVTGFRLSYQDNLDGKEEKDWPFHEFDESHPWQEDQRYSILPDVVSDKVKLFWATDKVGSDSELCYLQNITSHVYGKFEKMQTEKSLVPINLKVPDYLEVLIDNEESPFGPNPISEIGGPEIQDDYRRVGNITLTSGSIALTLTNEDYNYKDKSLITVPEFKDVRVEDAVLVILKVDLKDTDEEESHELDMSGVYFQDSGSIFLSTRSAKFVSGFIEPHMVFGEERFNKTQILMGQASMSYNLAKLSMQTETMLSWSQRCEFVGYIQLAKTQYDKKSLREIDDELHYPSGKPLPEQLPLVDIQDYLFYSPDCGIVLTSVKNEPFTGLRREELLRHIKKVLIGFLLLQGILLFALLRQINKTNTPGQYATISTQSLYLIAYQEALVVFAAVLFSTIVTELYLVLTCICIFGFVTCAIFEFRFIVNVLSAQGNERNISWWTILRGGVSSGRSRSNDGILEDSSRVTDENSVAPESNADIAPNPNSTPNPNPNSNAAAAATASETAPPTIPQNTDPVPSDSTRFSNNLFATGCFLTIIGDFVIFNSMGWKSSSTRIFEFIGIIFLNSCWLPQFFRNTIQNRRVGLGWEYILVTSATRFIPVAYLCLFSNPFRHPKDPILVLILFSWLLLQIFLLGLQWLLGPRFWIDEHWLPKAYDYQPILSIEDLENGFQSELLQHLVEVGPKVFNAKTECAICMTEAQVPVISDNEVRKSITTKGYMVTPCRHIFHEECLQDWMRYKLQCPVCRNGLPPT